MRYNSIRIFIALLLTAHSFMLQAMQRIDLQKIPQQYKVAICQLSTLNPRTQDRNPDTLKQVDIRLVEEIFQDAAIPQQIVYAHSKMNTENQIFNSQQQLDKIACNMHTQAIKDSIFKEFIDTKSDEIYQQLSKKFQHNFMREEMVASIKQAIQHTIKFGIYFYLIYDKDRRDNSAWFNWQTYSFNRYLTDEVIINKAFKGLLRSCKTEDPKSKLQFDHIRKSFKKPKNKKTQTALQEIFAAVKNNSLISAIVITALAISYMVYKRSLPFMRAVVR